MSEFIGYNANRGTWYTYDYDAQEDKGIVSIKQDVKPVLDFAKDQRNSGLNDGAGDFHRYAVIPAHVEVALRKKGINMYDPRQTKELLKEINQNYPLLRTGNLKHEIK